MENVDQERGVWLGDADEGTPHDAQIARGPAHRYVEPSRIDRPSQVIGNGHRLLILGTLDDLLDSIAVIQLASEVGLYEDRRRRRLDRAKVVRYLAVVRSAAVRARPLIQELAQAALRAGDGAPLEGQRDRVGVGRHWAGPPGDGAA